MKNLDLLWIQVFGWHHDVYKIACHLLDNGTIGTSSHSNPKYIEGILWL